MARVISSLIAVLLFFSSVAYASSRYDVYFYTYARRFFLDTVDWRWFKAQGIVESGLNPRAVSYCGAMGVMQLMPYTSAEIAKELKTENVPFDPKYNIMAGIYYDFKLYRYWRICDGYDRLSYMFSSYNSGLGNIIKANSLAPREVKCTWSAIETYLPRVTGKYSKETIQYVYRIKDIYSMLVRGKL